MNSFWSGIYDSFKDRRYGALFFGTFLALVGFLVVGSLICEAAAAYDAKDSLPVAAAWIGLVFVIWLGHGMWQMRERKYERLRFPPMSRDELDKARSKLVKKQHPKKL